MDEIIMSTGYRPPASEAGFVEPETSNLMDWQSSTISVAHDPQFDTAHPLTKPDDPPTAKQWEFYREIITELYLNDDRDLKDVIETMRSEYQFRARYYPHLSW